MKGDELKRNSEDGGEKGTGTVKEKWERESRRRKTKVKKEEEEGKVQRGEEEKKEGPFSKWH